MFSLYPKRLSMRDVTDGTSNTLFVGEVTINDGTIGNSYSQWAGIWAVSSTVTGINWSGRSNGWRAGHGFASKHVGGAHFLLADGAVRFISENLSLLTFGQLGSKAGNEVVGEF